MTPIEKNLLKELSKVSTEAGFFRGLVEGLLAQSIDMGYYYELPTEVHSKVQKAIEDFDARKRD